MEEANLRASGNGADGRVAPIQWYSRPALDEYLAEADRERARLRSTIDDANSRLARASAAVSLHQTMLEMLLESQRQITEIRRAAEAEAARIMAEGDREAQAILRAGDGRDGATQTLVRDASAPPAGTPSEVGATSGPPATPEAATPPVVTTGAAADDEFFTYLKGALAEDEPLGPGLQ